MRDSNLSGRRGRGRLLVPLALITTLLAACGAATPSVTPTPAPTPVPTPIVTPDPHLTTPTTVEVIYHALEDAGIDIHAYTAGSAASGEPTRWINATLDGWPMIISEFSTAKALAKARKWKKGAKPGQGEAPIAIKGLNILIEWGPMTGSKPPKPEPEQLRDLAAVIATLDPLIYPLTSRATVSVDVPKHTPLPTPSPVPSGESPSPSS